jgi:hypothetical protein
MQYKLFLMRQGLAARKVAVNDGSVNIIELKL